MFFYGLINMAAIQSRLMHAKPLLSILSPHCPRLFFSGETPPEALHAALGSPGQEEHGPVGPSPGD